MHLASKTLAVTLAIGLAGIGGLAWHGLRSTAHSVVAGDPPCSTTTAACGAHTRTKGGPAARIEGRPRLLVFTSHSCPACKRMEPVVEAAVATCDGGHDIERIDLDDDAEEGLATTYGVTLLPSYVSVDASGSEVARLTGVQPQARLESAIEEVRGVRCVSVDRVPDEKAM
jgi:cytochrome c-type biogenesis protein